MSETPIPQDGSQLEETRHNPSLSNDDRENVDNDGQESEDQAVDPRLTLMEQIADQNDEERRIKAGVQQEDMPAGEPVPEPGLQSQEQMNPAEDEEDQGLPDEYADDPLAEFIEMDGDEPMLRTVVDGHQKLVPLDKARASLQKNMAADARLQEASEAQKRIEEREKALAEREAALQANLQQAQDSAQPPNAGAEVSEEQLKKDAQELVGELFTGTQEEAAAKLADMVSKTRGVSTTQLNADQIAAKAVAAARDQLAREAVEKDVQSGFAKFQADYPEIASDTVLFQLADGMTTTIQKEHPDWMPSEVMAEAGKRTREWVEQQRGGAPAEEASEQTPAQGIERNERKRQLRRVPRARQGTPPKAEVEVEPSPSDVIAEMRKARGLPD